MFGKISSWRSMSRSPKRAWQHVYLRVADTVATAALVVDSAHRMRGEIGEMGCRLRRRFPQGVSPTNDTLKVHVSPS